MWEANSRAFLRLLSSAFAFNCSAASTSGAFRILGRPLLRLSCTLLRVGGVGGCGDDDEAAVAAASLRYPEAAEPLERPALPEAVEAEEAVVGGRSAEEGEVGGWGGVEEGLELAGDARVGGGVDVDGGGGAAEEEEGEAAEEGAVGEGVRLEEAGEGVRLEEAGEGMRGG